ncbi:MAG: hypothetical protein GXP30_01610, partial [Verrucomicrobia bacterium]|nr:hypothetical protein [Verrucomicrobiota bacterium]
MKYSRKAGMKETETSSKKAGQVTRIILTCACWVLLFGNVAVAGTDSGNANAIAEQAEVSD